LVESGLFFNTDVAVATWVSPGVTPAIGSGKPWTAAEPNAGFVNPGNQRVSRGSDVVSQLAVSLKPFERCTAAPVPIVVDRTGLLPSFTVREWAVGRVAAAVAGEGEGVVLLAGA